MTAAVYSHPDGPTLTYSASELTATDANGNAVCLSIGPDGLAALGAALIERSIAEKHGQVSERAGAAMGADLLQELLALRGRPQAEAFRAVHDKLHALSKLEHADSAAGGFAGVIVNVLELGIASLPKFEEGADE